LSSPPLLSAGAPCPSPSPSSILLITASVPDGRRWKRRRSGNERGSQLREQGTPGLQRSRAKGLVQGHALTHSNGWQQLALLSRASCRPRALIHLIPTVVQEEVPLLSTLLSFFATGCHYAAQTDLQLAILLPLPPQCWDYRHAPQQLAPLIER
jgi:hypothetical protein